MADGHDREALEFAAQFGGRVAPPLSAQQLDFVGGALESAATMVSLVQAERAREQTRSA